MTAPDLIEAIGPVFEEFSPATPGEEIGKKVGGRAGRHAEI
jgi:hypothetical protein